MIGNEKELSEDKVTAILKDVVESLVSDPSTAAVTLISSRDMLQFDVDVPEPERAKIIGSGGRVIKGLQNVIGAMGGKIGKDVQIEIVE